MKIALVTGASSGIGESASILLQKAGFTVYGAARRVEKMKFLQAKGIKTIALDVTKEESMQHCIETIIRSEGKIDVLVNNAGYGSYGAVEDVSIEEAKRQFEVNIFGLARLTQLVLPSMREQNFGRIINISSIGGKIYTPFGAWYHATKHALEGFTDALRLETKSFNIKPVIIEPGGIKTEWGDIAAENLKKTSGSGAYADFANKVADGMAEMYKGNRLSHPDVIGKVIVKAASANNPKTRYHAGAMSGLSLTARRLLSDKMFDKMVVKMM